MKIGVLASGEGTTLQAVMDACHNGCIPNSEVSVVISNNRSSGALRRAQFANIPNFNVSKNTHPIEEERDFSIRDILDLYEVDIVLLAGYMKKIMGHTLSRFKDRIFNMHPSLLPKFGGEGMYGDRVYKAAFDSGDPETGITFHAIDENYDTGPIIAQTKIPVFETDTLEILSKRIKWAEKLFIVNALIELEKLNMNR